MFLQNDTLNLLEKSSYKQHALFLFSVKLIFKETYTMSRKIFNFLFRLSQQNKR